MHCEQLVFPEQHTCTLERVDLPQDVAPGEVLVRNRLSLVSAGTELAMFTRTHRGFDNPDFAYAKYPFRPGYAAVGEVIACGTDVSDLAAGDRVAHAGKHARLAKLPAGGYVRVPDGVKDEDAVFLKMIEIAMGAPRLAPVRFGETVAVIGMGIVGNLCAQLCKLAGARLVAGADLLPTRLARALDCGVDRLCDLRERPLCEWASSLSAGGPSLIIEAVGAAAAISAAIKAVARGGRIVLLGSPRTPMEIDPYYDIHRTGARLIGAHCSLVEPSVREQDRQLILDLLTWQRLRLAPLRTHTMPLEEAQAAYEGLRDHPEEYLGVLLTYE